MPFRRARGKDASIGVQLTMWKALQVLYFAVIEFDEFQDCVENSLVVWDESYV
jgi:hypothetical protein